MRYQILLFMLMALSLCAPVFAGTITYFYDELDRLKEVTLENGQKITYDYDEIGNIKSKTPSGNVATITASASSGGAIYPNGTITITAGGSKYYSIEPSAGYRIDNVYVDGVAQGAITSYTFSSITASHSIAVYFGIDTSACPNAPVRLARATPVYYSSLQAAYNAAADGDVIQAQNHLLQESLNANRNISVTIDGGYDCTYGSNPDSTILMGSATLSSGTVTMKNLRIQN